MKIQGRTAKVVNGVYVLSGLQPYESAAMLCSRQFGGHWQYISKDKTKRIG